MAQIAGLPGPARADPARSGPALAETAYGLARFAPRTPWWGGDAQTLRNVLRPPAVDLSAWPARRLAFDAADGIDCLSGFWHQPRHASRADAPLVVMLHGLTGSAEGSLLQVSAAHLLEAGWPVLRLNLRGAGDTAPACRRQYHSGLIEDVDAVLAQLPASARAEGVALLGYSLGGNIVLNHLARRPDHPLVRAGMSVCAPIHPAAAVSRLEAPRNAAYARYLLAGMKREARRCDMAPALRDAVARATSIRHYDDTVTAPSHGFAGADAFYAAVASWSRLDGIAVPALALTAADDPWIPAGSYRDAARTASALCRIVIADGGGHCGFHDRTSPVPWHDRLFAAFLEAALAGAVAQPTGPDQVRTTAS